MNHPIEEIILASGSPRRKELLQRIGIPFRVVKSECEEITTKKEPCDVVMELSQQKAFDVYSKLSEAERRGRLVLGADTIVAILNLLHAHRIHFNLCILIKRIPLHPTRWILP